MRYLTFVTVAILTFGVGVLVSFISRTPVAEEAEIPPVAQSMEDDWHRLFEAAHMSKDEWLRDDVLGRLQCAGWDGSVTRRLVRGGDVIYCAESQDGVISSISPLPNNDAFLFVLRTHGDWSSKNLSFIRSISDPVRARSYIRHRLGSE